jgi:hypothetical protein
MSSNSRIFSRNHRLILAATVAVSLWIGGWGSAFAQKATESTAIKALRDLQIDLNDVEPNIPMPEIYNTPPKIVEQTVGGTQEFKLFYFCKHHTSDELKQIIHEQFASKLFDEEGKNVTLDDYTVSSNPATNQLIVRCPARKDVEAVLETLEQMDVPPIQVKIDCLISEIYADFTFDRETTIAIENLFGEDVAMKPGGTAFGADVQQLIQDDEYLPAFPGASLRELIRARMGLKIGYMSATHNLAALVDLLESRGYLKILMNPTLEIVNGKTATVKSTQHVPLEKMYITHPNQDWYETKTEYVDVIDSLEITPHVFADGYIGLETSIILGAKNTPDGVKQVPIITKKEIASKENRIRPGESLIIGGIRKTEKFGVARGVPLLKDIPLIGFLFSGEDIEQRAVETVFTLTPTYSTGGQPTKEVMEEIKRKHKSANTENLQNTISDIFDGKSDKEQQLLANEAEQSRLKAEAEKTEAQNAVKKANLRAEKAEAELGKLRTETAKIQAEAKEAKTRADEKARAADASKAAADKAEAKAKKAQAEAAEKSNESSETPKDEIQKPTAGENKPEIKA